MSTPVLRIAMEVPGTLVWGNVDPSSTFPYGGVELGFSGGESLSIDERSQDITDPTTGRVLDMVVGAESVTLQAVSRDWDHDALVTTFLNTVVGAATQHARIDIGGTNGAGYLYSARSNRLLFVPDSVRNGNGDIDRMVLFFDAMPRIQEGFLTQLRMGSRSEVPIEFIARPDSQGRLATLFFRGDEP